MSAASSWCTLLLRTKALQQTHLKVHACLTIAHGASRSLSSTAIRKAARPTPATATEVPADAKGKGKETTQEPTTRKPVDALPFLSRPLGIRERPSTVARSWQEEMMDQDTRMANRKKLYVVISFAPSEILSPCISQGKGSYKRLLRGLERDKTIWRQDMGRSSRPHT